MSNSRVRRSKTRIESSRWAAYVAAAASSMLGAPRCADADIHVVNVGLDLIDPEPGNGYFGNVFHATFGSGEVGFLLLHAYDETAPGYGILAVSGTLQGPGYFASIAADRPGSSFYAYRFKTGSTLSNRSFLSAGGRANLAWGGGYLGSHWLNAGGYMGFRFDVGQGTQYGWMELSLVSGTPANIFRLGRYAWADPGETLLTGQVPEAGSLGLLALGAFGLVAWRRRRSR
ncbi:MAG: PEP-CTERM sorting domain-containing protein [Planctomycetota bacterium]